MAEAADATPVAPTAFGRHGGGSDDEEAAAAASASTDGTIDYFALACRMVSVLVPTVLYEGTGGAAYEDEAAAATVAARGVEGIAVAAKSTTEQQLSEVIVAT